MPELPRVTIYVKVFHWPNNYFPVPNGHIGKSFVVELARLSRVDAVCSSLESVASKAVTVLCVLLLEHSHSGAKPGALTSCLVCRLELLQEG